MNDNVKINSNSVAIRNSLEVLSGVHGIIGELIEELTDSGSQRKFVLEKLLVCEVALQKQMYEISRCNSETYQITNKNSVKTTTK